MGSRNTWCFAVAKRLKTNTEKNTWEILQKKENTNKGCKIYKKNKQRHRHAYEKCYQKGKETHR